METPDSEALTRDCAECGEDADLLCPTCAKCWDCCECEDDYDADELGIDPEPE